MYLLSYLTILAALSVCTNSISFQCAGSSIAAGVQTFLQVGKKKKKKKSSETDYKEWGGGGGVKEN